VSRIQKDARLTKVIFTLLVGTIMSIPVWIGVGKYQLCKYYFPEINRMACLVTQLPGVVRKRTAKELGEK